MKRMVKKEKPLTVRQAKYLKALPTSKTKKEAAMKAGYTEETADNAKQKIEAMVGKSRMREAFEKAGITDERIAKTVRQAMKAKKALVVHTGKDSSMVHETPDYSTRIKAADLAGKFRGDFVEKIEHSGEIAGQVIMVLPKEHGSDKA